MRGILFSVVFLILFSFFPGGSLSESSCAKEVYYIRIIARDDSSLAQEEKLRLRDALLPLFPEKAEELSFFLPFITASAKDIAPCRVELRSWSPDQKTPPAPTVYITIGEGDGKNWWGVLYEGAKEMAASGETAYSDRVIIRWQLPELLKHFLDRFLILRKEFP